MRTLSFIQKLHPIHPLHISKQTKLIINSKQIIYKMTKHIWFRFITQCWAMKEQASLWKCVVRHNRTFAARIHKVWDEDTSQILERYLSCQHGWLKMNLPCAIRSNFSCAAPNFHLSLYKLHEKHLTLFFNLKETKFILLLLSKNKSTWYWIFDIYIIHT